MEIDEIGKIAMNLDVSERDLGDEVILIREGVDELYTFKDTALDIWRQLKAGKGAEDILESIAGDYDIDRNEAYGDLLEFLEDCKTKGLITY